MENEKRLRDIDEQVAGVLTPDADLVRRLTGHALATSEIRGSSMGPIAAVISVISLTVVGALWHTREHPSVPAEPTFTITGEGLSILVESSDGRRWFVGANTFQPATGSYVIAVQNGAMK